MCRARGSIVATAGFSPSGWLNKAALEFLCYGAQSERIAPIFLTERSARRPGLTAAPGEDTNAGTGPPCRFVSRNTILNRTPAVPLVVDVDGSLVRGDLLTEGLAAAVRRLARKIVGFSVHGWPPGARPLKRWLVHDTTGTLAGAATLVLNPAVAARRWRTPGRAGREVWLASGSDDMGRRAPGAETMGATGCFASDGRTNLVGRGSKAMPCWWSRFGERGFDYVGNERRDLAVWKRARRAIGVDLSASPGAKQVKTLDRQTPACIGGSRRRRPSTFLRALRPRQWMANPAGVRACHFAAGSQCRAVLHYLAAGGHGGGAGGLRFQPVPVLRKTCSTCRADRLDGKQRRCRPLASGKTHLAGHDWRSVPCWAPRGLALAFRLSTGRGSRRSPVVRRLWAWVPSPLASGTRHAARASSARALLNVYIRCVVGAAGRARPAQIAVAVSAALLGQLTQRIEQG